MARLNQPTKHQVTTHEGAPVVPINAELQLRRSVMSCMLWEDTFYEDGVSIADRIHALAAQVEPETVAQLAIQARTEGKLRHVPLWLTLGLTKGGRLLADTVYQVINRPDELAEVLAMYWKDGKKPLRVGLKDGLARAFNKFDEYQFAKWNKDGEIKLRDVMFLVHPNPKDDKQADIFKKIADGTLAPPDTWESRLTRGEDKKATFTDLLKRNKLGYMALLRNLRKMTEEGVDRELIKQRLLEGAGKNKALPFRFLSAARHAPQFERELDQAMMLALSNREPLTGRTIIAIDCSASMGSPVSGKSEITCFDAAAAMAILLSGICTDLRVLAFGETVKEVPPRQGMALRDAIRNAPVGHSTFVGKAVTMANKLGFDRMIVVTDGQSWDTVPNPVGTGWMNNVASYQYGVGYGAWNQIDGFSEAAIDFIQLFEKETG